MSRRWTGDGTDADAFKRIVIHGSRRRRLEWPLWTAVLVVSVFVLGFWTGHASAAPPRDGVCVWKPAVCVYHKELKQAVKLPPAALVYQGDVLLGIIRHCTLLKPCPS